MTTITILEADWKDSIYRTREWERTVDIKKWTHDIENGKYIIKFEKL